jgi:hypothetical protein
MTQIALFSLLNKKKQGIIELTATNIRMKDPRQAD